MLAATCGITDMDKDEDRRDSLTVLRGSPERSHGRYTKGI